MTAAILLILVAAVTFIVAAVWRVPSNRVRCVHCGAAMALGNQPARASLCETCKRDLQFQPTIQHHENL